MGAKVSSETGLEVEGGALVEVTLPGVADPMVITLGATYTKDDGFKASLKTAFPITPPEWGLNEADVEITYDSTAGIWAKATLEDRFDIRSIIPSASFVPVLDFKASVETGGQMSMSGTTSYRLPSFLGNKDMNLLAQITDTGMTIYGNVNTS